MKKNVNLVSRCLSILMISLLTSSLLLASSNVRKMSLSKTAITKALQNFEVPKLSAKASQVDGDKTTFTFDISFVDDTVQKAMDDIKNAHKPGASIGFEFSIFEVDKTAKTLKVEMGSGISNQKEIMEHLQKQLDSALK